MENETEVTVTSSSESEPAPPPPAPPPPTQVVALETAGVAEVAREQGAQAVTLEALAALVARQGSEIASLREAQARVPALVEATVAETVEVEPEPEATVTEVDVPAIIEPAPTDESEATTSARTPRRERHPVVRMFLGRLP